VCIAPADSIVPEDGIEAKNFLAKNILPIRKKINEIHEHTRHLVRRRFCMSSVCLADDKNRLYRLKCRAESWALKYEMVFGVGKWGLMKFKKRPCAITPDGATKEQQKAATDQLRNNVD
jgi:hypothetical protein